MTDADIGIHPSSGAEMSRTNIILSFTPTATVAQANAAMQAAHVKTTDAVRSLPRHPFVVRDLSVVVADTLPAEIIHGTIQAAGENTPAPLAGIGFFDRYHGKGIPDGAVSLSVRLTFQAPDRTLTDAEVQASVDAVLASLVREHGAVRR